MAFRFYYTPSSFHGDVEPKSQAPPYIKPDIRMYHTYLMPLFWKSKLRHRVITTKWPHWGRSYWKQTSGE